MKKLFVKLNSSLCCVDKRLLRLLITLGSLALFAIAAGAPDSTGGLGM
jgi:hypothetical protein